MPLQHKYWFKIVNYMLCNIHGDFDLLFDDLYAILGKDFVRILLIVENNNCASIVNTYIQKFIL